MTWHRQKTENNVVILLVFCPPFTEKPDRKMSVCTCVCLTHRHSLCGHICDGNVAVGYGHQGGEYSSFLGIRNQLEPEQRNSQSQNNHINLTKEVNCNFNILTL